MTTTLKDLIDFATEHKLPLSTPINVIGSINLNDEGSLLSVEFNLKNAQISLSRTRAITKSNLREIVDKRGEITLILK